MLISPLDFYRVVLSCDFMASHGIYVSAIPHDTKLTHYLSFGLVLFVSFPSPFRLPSASFLASSVTLLPHDYTLS